MTTTAREHTPAAHLTSTPSTTLQHPRKTDKDTETDQTTTRSKPSHHCITIRGAVPASGRPATANLRVDLEWMDLPSSAAWLGC